MTVKCPKCQTDNPETARFCNRCATPLLSSADISVTKTLETPKDELSRGATFAERYEIIEELGKGGMGNVYRVYDTKIKEEVALKLLKPEIASDKRTIERFSNELKFARKIRHQNVCQMFELMEEEGTHFITMEYVSGEDLKSFIRRVGKLPSGKAITIAKQVCEGLVEAHKLGVIHRDLKPSNIMVDDEGNARIMDFGIARSLKAEGITGEGVIIGTPEYMSPEQVEGKEANQQSDIYALGVILYEMVTGQIPFEGDTPFSIAYKHKHETPQDPRKLNPQITESLNRFILKCMEKDREQRYQTAEELLSGLIKIEEGVPTAERVIPKRKPITPREITVTLRPRKILIPVLIVVAAVIAAVILWRPWSPKETAAIPSDKPSLAVMYSENITGDESLDHWRKGLAELLITDLYQSKYIDVLSGDKLYDILEDLNQLDAKSYSTQIMKEVASRGRCSHVIRGNYFLAGPTLRINLSIMDSRTEKIIASETVEGEGINSILSLVDDFTRKIKTDLNVSPEEIAKDVDKKIGEITTSSPEAYRYYCEGYDNYKKGEARKAIQFFERAIALDPMFAMAYRDLAANYHYEGYSSEWKEYMAKAFELSDRVSERERYLLHGEYYRVVEGDLNKAIRAYTKLLEIYPDDPKGNFSLAVVYYVTEEWEKAIERQELNVKYESEDFRPYQHLAAIYHNMGLYDKAKEVIENFLNNIQDSSGMRIYLVYNYLYRGEYVRALAETETIFRKYPDFDSTLAARGDIFLCKGDFIQAEKEYRMYMQREAPVPTVGGIASLVDLYLLQGKFKEAVNIMNQGKEMEKKMGVMMGSGYDNLRLSYLYLKIGNPEASLKELEDVLQNEIENNWQQRILNRIGLTYVEMNSLAEAIGAADIIKETNEQGMYKKYIRYYYHLMGEIELRSENYSKAIEYLIKANSLMPYQNGLENPPEDHALFIDPLARAYYRAGDLDKARAEYERITQLTTGRIKYGDIYAKSFYMLGKIHRQQGDTAKAFEHYKKFLDLWKDADPGIAEVEDAKERLTELKSLSNVSNNQFYLNPDDDKIESTVMSYPEVTKP